MRWQTTTGIGLALLVCLGACGRKADPQPAESVRPRPITTLSGAVAAEGDVRLVWVRPEDYVNGKRMDDLGGFLVFRGEPGASAEEIANIPVLDRDRFQREKKFEHLDPKASSGKTYYYRVVSYTTDKYFSAPSNQVMVTIEP